MSKIAAPNSLIGEGTVFEGKFDVDGSLRIDGFFEGQLKVSDHLFISPVGKLKTDTVYTKTIAVSGILVGNIEASEEIHLLSTGRILGNIKAPKLFMEPGVVVQGAVDITGTENHNLNQIVSSFKINEPNSVSSLSE
ncbi:MAG: bactofilin family protein [Brevinemataceae bacterium]